jgi:spore coat polysaccharide biosynthesis predicted glycosyltransferase SpsG
MGHVARCTAVACALGERGAAVRCLGFDAEDPFELDGIAWEPLAAPEPADLVDSYLRDPAEFGARAAFVDEGEPSPGVELVIGPRGLAPPLYACLRRPYWTPPERPAGEEVRRVLVSTGMATPAAPLADAVAEALPEAEVRVTGSLGQRATAIGTPDTLRPELEAVDLVVCGAGQTMLEALATARPVVAVVTADNQRAQAETVEASVVLAGALEAPSAAAALAADPERRRLLATRTVDGQGAHRVAEALLAALE